MTPPTGQDTRPEPTRERPSATDLPSSALLEPFLALMPDAAVVVGADGLIVLANEQAAALFAYEGAELAGRSIETLVPERFRARHRDDRSDYTTSPRSRPMGAGQELSGRRRDGTEFPVDISLAPLPGTTGLIIAAIRDASGRRAAQQVQSQLAAIVDSSVDGIVSLTLQGHLSSWNPGAAGLFGYAAAEVLGSHLSLLVPEDRSTELEELLDAAMQGTPTAPRDTQWRRRDGSVLDVALSVSPLTDGSEEPVGFSALLRDVTERKRRERQLAATDTVRSHLLSGAPIEESLRAVCDEACRLLGADGAVVVLADETGTARARATTARHADLAGRGTPTETSLAARVLETATPHVAPSAVLVDASAEQSGPAVGVPVLSSRGVHGALLLSRAPGSPRFVDDDIAVLGPLADQAALGIELGRARERRERALVVGDRERIGHDLHELIIQRLFAIGLNLQGITRLNPDPMIVDRIERAIETLDATIHDVRSAIFRLDGPSAPA